MSADASVRVGETSVLTETRELSAQCATSALDGRIRELEDQKASLQAESDALGMVNGYLKGLAGGGGESGGGVRAPADARNLVAVTEAMRRTGQDSLLKQHQIQRRQTDIDRQLNPLLAERTRAQGSGDKVMAVTVTLATGADADVKLSYQVNGPGWTPTYRALLDSTTRKVRIERQALVAQATGEDWRGVKLVLSTGQPRRETTGRLPSAWRIGVEPPPQPPVRARAYESAPMPAAAPITMAADAKQMMDERRAPLFDVTVFDSSFATEFSIPQAIDVPSNGQRVTLALGQHEDTAKLVARTSPRVDAQRLPGRRAAAARGRVAGRPAAACIATAPSSATAAGPRRATSACRCRSGATSWCACRPSPNATTRAPEASPARAPNARCSAPTWSRTATARP